MPMKRLISVSNWDHFKPHDRARHNGMALAEELKQNPNRAIEILKLKDDLDISVAEVLAVYHGAALAEILGGIPQQALEILSLRNVFGNSVVYVLAEHHETALATILEKIPQQALAILSLPTNETLAVSMADLLMKLHNTPGMSPKIKGEIIEKIRAFPKTPFAIFRIPFLGSGFSLGTFPTQGEPCFRHSSDTSEENKPKRETAIQAEFITSVREQAALIKKGAEQDGLQLPALAYTDPIVCRRLLKGLLDGTISNAFTIGTNTLTVDVIVRHQVGKF